jgi:hypothetical protein
MDNNGIIPAITGIAVGIAFVVVFSILYASSSSAMPNDHNQINLTIEGMKSTYLSGEQIIFSVNAEGVSDNTCNIGSPSVLIRDENSGKVIYWPHPFGFNTAIKCANIEPINKEWVFGDDAESVIVLDKAGSYTVIASLEEVTIERHFAVAN